MWCVAGVGRAHGEAEVEATENDGWVLEAVWEDDTHHVTLAEAQPHQGSSNLQWLLSDLKQDNLLSVFLQKKNYHFSV